MDEPTVALTTDTDVVQMQDVSTRFGSQTVHEHLNLAVRRGEILAIAGGSGSGKSVLLREMILLQQASSGCVRVFGDDVSQMDAEARQRLRERWGVMFQKGGLFSALTVLENVGLPMREQARRGTAAVADIDAQARAKLALTGLPADAASKLPGALSGGMLKRAALARALALEPELLFLDEPTSGLDPASAAGICELILQTQAQHRCTMVVISHDVNLLWQVSDRVAVLGEGQVLALDTMAALASNPHPIVQAYFVDARRGRETASTAVPAATATAAAAAAAA